MTGVDPAAFRLAAGRFTTGIVVVSATLDGVPHSMTVSAFTSVSLDPLLVLFCAEKVARFHDAVLAAGSWAVSVLDEESEKVSRARPAAGTPRARTASGSPRRPTGRGRAPGGPRRRAARPAGRACARPAWPNVPGTPRWPASRAPRGRPRRPAGCRRTSTRAARA